MVTASTTNKPTHAPPSLQPTISPSTPSPPNGVSSPPIDFPLHLPSDLSLHCRSMRPSDYPKVLELLPLVSRCSTIHSPSDLLHLLSLPTFHPICCYDLHTNELIAFIELHRLPHLGRAYDGRIERLVVAASHRNRGIATYLCKAVCCIAFHQLKCGRIDLTVEKPAARAIYEDKLAFKAVDTTTMRIMKDEWTHKM